MVRRSSPPHARALTTNNNTNNISYSYSNNNNNNTQTPYPNRLAHVRPLTHAPPTQRERLCMYSPDRVNTLPCAYTRKHMYRHRHTYTHTHTYIHTGLMHLAGLSNTLRFVDLHNMPHLTNDVVCVSVFVCEYVCVYVCVCLV